MIIRDLLCVFDSIFIMKNIKNTFNFLKKRTVFRRLNFRRFNYRFSNDNFGGFDLGLEPENPLVPLNPNNGPKILFCKKELSE